MLAEADSRERMLAGRGESQRIMQVGLSEASVLMRKINSFGDPRLYAVNEVADRLAQQRRNRSCRSGCSSTPAGTTANRPAPAASWVCC